MRHHVVPFVALLLAACAVSPLDNPPPAGRFYFPTGLMHADVPGLDAGVLFVANANLDRRYSSGSVVAVNLDQVAGLPAFPAVPDGGPLVLTALGDVQRALVTDFAGEMAALELTAGKLRLFVPSRSEGMKFQAVDATLSADRTTLGCFPPGPVDAPLDCGANAPSLSPVEFEQGPGGVPRASAPYGVAVAQRACATAVDCGPGRVCSAAGRCQTFGGEAFADAYVTHLIQADSPIASGLNLRGYLVRVESDVMAVDVDNFIDIGLGATNSVAVGQRWVYTTGRYLNPTPNLLRLVDWTTASTTVIATGLEAAFQVQDSRGIALGTGEHRLYVLTRTPDLLLVLGVAAPAASSPGVSLLQAVPLPNGPNELKVIPRAGRGDLVAVSCSGSAVVALYDEDVGQLVAQVTSVGQQPFGIATDLRGGGARLYVTDFGDGRVAVIDLPDLLRPQEARVVAHLGVDQLCLTKPTQTAGCPPESR
jgi:DNA-binding beta-propeller fold protein YncE